MTKKYRQSVVLGGMMSRFHGSLFGIDGFDWRKRAVYGVHDCAGGGGGGPIPPPRKSLQDFFNEIFTKNPPPDLFLAGFIIADPIHNSNAQFIKANWKRLDEISGRDIEILCPGWLRNLHNELVFDSNLAKQLLEKMSGGIDWSYKDGQFMLVIVQGNRVQEDSEDDAAKRLRDEYRDVVDARTLVGRGAAFLDFGRCLILNLDELGANSVITDVAEFLSILIQIAQMKENDLSAIVSALTAREGRKAVHDGFSVLLDASFWKAVGEASTAGTISDIKVLATLRRLIRPLQNCTTFNRRKIGNQVLIEVGKLPV